MQKQSLETELRFNLTRMLEQVGNVYLRYNLNLEIHIFAVKSFFYKNDEEKYEWYYTKSNYFHLHLPSSFFSIQFVSCPSLSKCKKPKKRFRITPRSWYYDLFFAPLPKVLCIIRVKSTVIVRTNVQKCVKHHQSVYAHYNRWWKGWFVIKTASQNPKENVFFF